MSELFASLQNIEVIIVIWIVLALGITLVLWRNRQTMGLSLAFLAFYILYYWLPALFYIIPNYDPVYERELTRVGFMYSLYGLIGFAIGAVFLGPLLRRFHMRRTHLKQKPSEPRGNSRLNIPIVYLESGLIFTLVISPILLRVPTLNAASSSLTSLLDIGLFLLYWNNIDTGRRKNNLIILILLISFPFITTITQGFLGQGIGIIILFIIFVARRTKHFARYLPFALVVSFVLLSISVNYFTYRRPIRASVWGGDDLAKRIQTLNDTIVTNFEWFDPNNASQLYYLDSRLGFNFLSGATVQHLSQNGYHYTYGETYISAFLSLVPRVFWRDKPVVAGGSEIVTQYTGISYDGTTSVSPSLIMEAYVNFGDWGVIGFFIFWGTLLVLLDYAAFSALLVQNYLKFAVVMIPALPLLQSTADFTVISVTALSGLGSILIFNRLIVRYWPILRQPLSSSRLETTHDSP